MRRPAKRIEAKPGDRPTEFGKLGNADYVVAQSKEAVGLTGERDALVVVDMAEPEYIDCFPLMFRHNADAYGALREFYGDVVPGKLYTDNAPELVSARQVNPVPPSKQRILREAGTSSGRRRQVSLRAGRPRYLLLAVRGPVLVLHAQYRDRGWQIGVASPEIGRAHV